MLLNRVYLLCFVFGLLVLACPISAGLAGAAQVDQAVAPASAPAPDALAGGQPASRTEPVSLEADSLSYDGAISTYEASGNVVLRQGEVSLTADHLLLQSETQDVIAEGDVKVSQAGDELFGNRLHYNLTTARGSVLQGRVFLSEKNFHLAGAAVEKTAEATYHVDEGRFTTCDGEVPDWEFTASQVDLTLGRYATARHAWFRVHDVPLVYFPYLIFPVKSERESGFLMPSFGHSREKGVKTSLAWYQVISRNQDATLYLDYLSRKGLGTGLEYRYLLGRNNQGEARYYHVSGISATPDLYAFDWLHDGTLPGGVHLTADVHYADDRQFFQDFGEVAEDYNREKTLATVIAQRNWEKFNLAGHVRYLKDLETDNDNTLQKLPELSAAVPRYRLGSTPLYLGFESYATRFYSKAAEDGERLYLRPTVGAVFKPGTWLEVSPEIALTQRFYSAGANDDEVSVPEYAATLSTRLQRVFALDRWGIDSLRHSIEPEISYIYVPGVAQEKLPLFDSIDRLPRQNRIEYALINRVTAKSTHSDGLPSYRELFKLRLSQSYDIAESRDREVDDTEPFSALRIELDVKPTRQSFLAVDGRVAAHDAVVFKRLDVEAGFDDGRGNRLKSGYHYRRELPSEPGLSADYLSAVVETSALRPIYLHLEERHDFQAGVNLETVVGLEYRARCWSVLLSFRDRLEDQQVMLSFALAGLGGSDGFW